MLGRQVVEPAGSQLADAPAAPGAAHDGASIYYRDLCEYLWPFLWQRPTKPIQSAFSTSRSLGPTSSQAQVFLRLLNVRFDINTYLAQLMTVPAASFTYSSTPSTLSGERTLYATLETPAARF